MLSFIISAIENTAILLLGGCIICFVGLTIVDRIDYHYSKKRGEI